ncbi:hypothetical protein EVAR_57090_1 [Eumeta japonica]|uniref:Uncharacterized protein n=1 Tax=Eumeta variegata TaxID=151549 RepID=A0A4C1Z7M9_EUMVA|nr:hypothetical protein EVAR_57090_1 [Eumeta japonica]
MHKVTGVRRRRMESASQREASEHIIQGVNKQATRNRRANGHVTVAHGRSQPQSSHVCAGDLLVNKEGWETSPAPLLLHGENGQPVLISNFQVAQNHFRIYNFTQLTDNHRSSFVQPLGPRRWTRFTTGAGRIGPATDLCGGASPACDRSC